MLWTGCRWCLNPSGSIFPKPLAALIDMDEPQTNSGMQVNTAAPLGWTRKHDEAEARMHKYLTWLFTNDIADRIEADLEKYFEELREFKDNESVCGITHPGVRQQAELQYKEGVDGFKGAMERLDRTLAIVLVATGWVATSSPFAWYVFAPMLASAVVLFCGRINVNAAVPVSFLDNVESHLQVCEHEQYHDMMNFVDARQFEKARAVNDMHVSWIQHRIGFGTALFILGLLSLGISRLL